MPVFITRLEGALDADQQEHLHMLGAVEIQKHLRDCLFHGLWKSLYDSLCYLYGDSKVMYPQLVITAHQAESEHEDQTGEGIWIKSAHVKQNDKIKNLKEKIVQLWMAIQNPCVGTAPGSFKQLVNSNNGNGSDNSLKGKWNGHHHHDKCYYSKIQCYNCKGGVTWSMGAQVHNWMKSWGRSQNPQAAL